MAMGKLIPNTQQKHLSLVKSQKKLSILRIMQQADPTYLLGKTGIRYQPVGFYDVPEYAAFKPVREARSCVFAYFKEWQKGKSLLLSRKQYGCPGAGKWLCSVQNRSREDYIRFLADEEGLKASHELMGLWLDHEKPYRQKYEHLVIGPLRADQYQYLRSATFFVNPDQLSILAIGAQLYSRPGESPVIAPFGSGCMQMVSLFRNLDEPQAIIGATDMAMRKYLPPEILAFTVTRPMFEQLCSLDRSSFLEKRFLSELIKVRARQSAV